MDGRGAWRDNVFVERLWRSVKYEHVYKFAYASVNEACTKIAPRLQNTWTGTTRAERTPVSKTKHRMKPTDRVCHNSRKWRDAHGCQASAAS